MNLSANRYLRPLDTVAIFDPAIATRNAGDEIISDASRAEIRRLLPSAFQATLPTHERVGPRSYRFCWQARHRIIAGSNILCDAMLFDRQWRLRPWDTIAAHDMIALAVGWRSYRDRRSPLSDVMLRRVLAKTGLHSVRDEHTRQRLLARGVTNVINTACVTMWNLDTAALASLPRAKAHRVVTTVNVGRENPRDIDLMRLLVEEYDEVYLWPQGASDGPYIARLLAAVPPIRVVGATLAAYDELLADSEPLDFVGNRLHAGIRALQHKRRALIVSVDNRASEIARDTNLPVASFAEGLAALRDRIRAPQPIEITLPYEQISAWRAQF